MVTPCTIRHGQQKKSPRPAIHPAAGRQNATLGLSQAGPRLPAPVKRLGAAIECCREGVNGLPGAQPDGRCEATTSRFRIGRTLFHCAAFVPDLTSKGIRKFCQAKSACFARFLRAEHHISRSLAAPAAIGGINVPIGAPIVVARQSSQARERPDRWLAVGLPARGTCLRGFHRGRDARPGTAETERGAEFLVAEGRAEAEGAKDATPAEGGPGATSSRSSFSL